MIEVVAFDADDTLWHNEPIFQATESRLVELLTQHHPEPWVRERLFATEMKNLRHYGYGIKGFVLSMIETAIDLSEGQIEGKAIREILSWGQSMLTEPVQLLDGVRETVERLSCEYKLMLLTKGDLFDQESKLARSGLGEFFSFVEIVSSKDASTYQRLITRHGLTPAGFVMVGNSLKSDVLPALDAGALAVHVPYDTTWAHEVVPEEALHGRDFARVGSIRDLPAWLGSHG